MSDFVLFSPVGGHDPIASYHDGAILHICRTYRPKKVYLYLSHEMVQRSQLDDRYCASLHLLEMHLDYKIDEIKLIERDDLRLVHLYDTFYNDFEKILRRIHTENPEMQLLINLSSGTPAMKNALNLIVTLSPYKMTAIQVASPNERENPKDEDPQKYDVETFWQFDEDNTEDYRNRCMQEHGINLLARIKKESIVRLVNAYDYSAALMLAKEIEDFVSADSIKLLQAAICRLQLDRSGFSKAMNGLTADFLPIKTGDQCQLFEYILGLQIRVKQKNYVDFIRGLTPVVLDLFEMCLKNELEIDIHTCCKKQLRHGHQVECLSIEKMEASQQGKNILSALNKRWNNKMREEPYNSMHIYCIFDEYAEDREFVQELEKIRNVESRVRNFAAHEITSVTDEWIKTQVHMTSEEIMKLLKHILRRSGINIKKEYWNSYDEMNKQIVAALYAE
jgi:CRISPR type III-A/MTUBE-associated protein Csm6